jgi:hypothetical protein
VIFIIDRTQKYALASNVCVSIITLDELTFSIILKLDTGSSAPTESVTDGSSQLEPHVKTTPGLVKAVCWLMVNLLAQSPGDAVQNMKSSGLVRLLFR